METSVARVQEKICPHGDHARSLETYRHAPLGKDEVRVLRILDASDDTIKCTLEHVSADRLAFGYKYYALSYCWGTGEADSEIIIDGKVFFITANLFCALQAVRRYMNYSAQSANAIWAIDALWADAICLDQANDEEKSDQVQRMHRIYRSAVEVIVWLGEEADGSSWAMMLLQWLKDSCFPLSGYHGLGRGRRSIQKLLETRMTSRLERYNGFVSHNLPQTARNLQPVQSAHEVLVATFPADHDLWTACDRLMTRAWFSRVWTYQEIHLARQAIVLCGDEHADWDAVCLWRSRCFAPFRTWYIYPWLFAPIWRAFPLQRGPSWTNSHSGAEDHIAKRTLQDLLVQTDDLYARDKRDYLYGFLGLLDETTRATVPVDYNLSPSDVFTSTVRLASSAPNGIDFWCHLIELYGVAQSSDMADLPSWCPDLSNRAQHVSGWPFMRPRPFCEEIKRAAAPKKSITFGTGQILRVTGIVMDKVSESATLAAYGRPCKYYAVEEDSYDHTFSTHHEQWLDEISTLFPANDSTHERWLREYFYAPRPTGNPDLQRRFEQFREVSRKVHAYPSTSKLAGFLNLGLPESVQLYILDDAIGYMYNNGRYFFKTQEGRIGFSPRPTRPGDRVCFVGGANYFYILSADLTTWVTFAALDSLREETPQSIIQSQAWRTFELK
ncbi:hypothetical protein LTR42_012084 [Elasticomyces elasticus]|nr:hypothetical protein LTR42_012084 [Elasticomyces elasticus]